MPADIYGVGSWLLSSCDVRGTNNDFTADVVRVRIDGRWYDLAKTGRKAWRQPDAGEGPVSAAPQRRRATGFQGSRTPIA